MSLSEAIDHIRPAVETGPAFQEEAAVFVLDGMMSTRNMALAASYPAPELPNFCVPAVKFMKAVQATPKAEIKVTPKRVTVKNDSKSFLIQRIEDVLPVGPPADEGVEADPVLCMALATMTRFCAKETARPWTMSVLCHDGYLWATNNFIMVRSVERFEGNPFEGLSLPNEFANYLARYEIERYGVTDDQFYAYTKGGGYVKAGKLANQMPLGIPELFVNAYQEPSWEVPQQWREVFLDASRNMDEVVEVESDKVVSKMMNDQVVGHVKSNIDFAAYTAKYLASVISVASKIDFKNGEPSSFSGEAVCGLLAGRAPE